VRFPKNETAPPKNSGEITRLLRAWHGGSNEAQDELWPILYDELRKLAGSILRGRGEGAQGQATSLVHKAYLRLLGSDVVWNDRRHFFAVAARAMRFVLVDEARRQLAHKRGDGETLSLGDALPEVADPLAHRPEEILAVHEALTKLSEIRPRQAKLVELRYFAGLSVEETADILEVTTRTVVRDWKTVRIWLHGELKGAA
jgi:RNA polymerase sigma factor (TIGR02999 family)